MSWVGNKTKREKEKMLVSSIFSFFLNAYNGVNQKAVIRQEGHDGPGVAHLSFPDCVV